MSGELNETWMRMYERDDVVIESEDVAYVGHWKVERTNEGWSCQKHPQRGIIPSFCEHAMAVRVELQKSPRAEEEG